MKRYVCLLVALALLLTFSACGSKVKEADIPGSDGLEFESNSDGTCTVVGIGSCTDANLIIPAQNAKGEKVVAIDDWAFSENRSITSLTITDMELEIEKYAFYQCKNLETVTIQNSTLKIGDSSFCDMGLKEFTVSDSTVETHNNAFWSCTDLSKIDISGSTIELCMNLYDSDLESLKIIDSEVEIADYCFQGCAELSEVIMEDSTVMVGNGAFQDTFANDGVFTVSDCSLTLSDYALNGCGLTSFSASGWDITIGECAFYDCTKLESLELDGENVVLEEESVTFCDELETVTITAEYLELRDRAISYCDKLSLVTLNSDDIIYGKDGFNRCGDSLQIVANGENVDNTGAKIAEKKTDEYYDVHNLTLVLPSGMTYLEIEGRDAAYYCTYEGKLLAAAVLVEKFERFAAYGYDVTTMTREEYGNLTMTVNGFENAEIQNDNGIVAATYFTSGYGYYYTFWKDSDAFYTVCFFSYEQDFEALLPVMQHYSSQVCVGGGL